MGDHLRKVGMGCHLIGKTHMVADAEGMERLGLAPDSVIGVRQSECGFDPFVRDDGLVAEGPSGKYDPKPSPYNEALKEKGYPGDNPWHDFANSGVEGDDVASGLVHGQFRQAGQYQRRRQRDPLADLQGDRISGPAERR